MAIRVRQASHRTPSFPPLLRTPDPHREAKLHRVSCALALSAVWTKKFDTYRTVFPTSNTESRDGTIHATEGPSSGTNIFDEIPIDCVAILILLHIAAGTRGVAHRARNPSTPRNF
jgi:hypothetical protein